MAKKKAEPGQDPVKDTVVGRVMADPQHSSGLNAPKLVRGRRGRKNLRRGNAPSENMQVDVGRRVSKREPDTSKEVTFPRGSETARKIQRAGVVSGLVKEVDPNAPKTLDEAIDRAAVSTGVSEAPSETKPATPSVDIDAIKSDRDAALNDLNAHKTEHGDKLDESHPEFAKRKELTGNYEKLKKKVSRATQKSVAPRVEARENARAVESDIVTTAAPEALGTTHFEQYGGHIKRMRQAYESAKTAATPEARAKLLAEADSHKIKAQSLDDETKITSLHPSIQSVCSTAGCHGVHTSTSGVCKSCDAHEEVNGMGSASEKVLAHRASLTGTFDSPQTYEPKEVVKRKQSTAVEKEDKNPKRLMGIASAIENDTIKSNGLNWWDQQVTNANLHPHRHRRDELPLDAPGPIPSRVGEGKRRINPLLTGEEKPSEEETRRIEQPESTSEPKKVSLVEAGAAEFTKSELAERATPVGRSGVGLGARVGEKTVGRASILQDSISTSKQ